MAASVANPQPGTGALFKYVNGIYNTRRRHFEPEGKSAADFE
jgi:hypothetical protein